MLKVQYVQAKGMPRIIRKGCSYLVVILIFTKGEGEDRYITHNQLLFTKMTHKFTTGGGCEHQGDFQEHMKEHREWPQYYS